MSTLDSIPKYVRIADQYRRRIECGELRPGDRLPSFVEVRAQTGVGQSTLERAHEILEREALIVREPGKGIFVARPKKRPRSGIVGLSGIHVAKGHHPYFARLLEGVQQMAHKAGVEILLLHEDLPVVPDKVDGVLLYSINPDNILRCLPASMPVVTLLNPARGVSGVTVDDATGVTRAVEYLVSLGHQRISYLGGWTGNAVARRRQDAYRNALVTSGITPQDEWLRVLPDAESVTDHAEVYRTFIDLSFQTMSQWLEEGWSELNCTALLVHNDDAAVGAIRALTAAGLSVPADVSVMGYDDTLNAELFEPPLSTMRVPLRELGARAMEMLLEEIEHAPESVESHPNAVFKPGVVERQSTRALKPASAHSGATAVPLIHARSSGAAHLTTNHSS